MAIMFLKKCQNGILNICISAKMPQAIEIQRILVFSIKGDIMRIFSQKKLFLFVFVFGVFFAAIGGLFGAFFS